MPLVLGLSGVLVALVLGVGLVWWLTRGGGGAAALKPWVPADAQGFVSVRMADLWKTEQASILRQKAKEESGADLEEKMEKTFGLKPTDIERLTFVAFDVERKLGWLVVETAAPYDEAKLRGKLEGVKEVTYEGKKFYTGKVEGDRSENAVHFAGPRLLVFAENETGIKKALSRSADNKAGPLDDGLALLSTSRLVVAGFRPHEKIREALEKFPDLKAIGEYEAGTLVVTVGTKTTVEVGLRFADSTKAATGKKAAEKGIKQLYGFAVTAKLAAPKAAIPFLDEVEKFLDGVAVSQSGSVVSAKGEADTSKEKISELIKAAKPR
jgi:hypothetical protein